MKDTHYTYLFLEWGDVEIELDCQVHISWYPYRPATMVDPAEGGNVDDFTVRIKQGAKYVDPPSFLDPVFNSPEFEARLNEEFHFEAPSREDYQ